jgi:hypothetical protein
MPCLQNLLPALVPAALAIGAPHAAGAAPVLPDFGAATFSSGAPIDNLYLPWKVGARSAQVARGFDDGEPFEERDEQTVLGEGPTIGGVVTTTVLDKSYEDGALVEETSDYYAQDSDGNVWYMGEDSVAFEYDDEGNLIGTSTAGSWRAAVNGALPGYAMPGMVDVGFEYYQEFAPNDDALDTGETFAVLDSLEVGGIVYRDVLQVFETTELEPDSREFKYYAPTVGLIRVEEGLDASLSNPELTFDRVEVAPIPLPPGLVLIGTAVVGLFAFGRRQITTTFAPIGTRS